MEGNKYLIVGADIETGEPVTRKLMAHSERMARDLAHKAGVAVSECGLISAGERDRKAAVRHWYLRALVWTCRVGGIILVGLAIYAVIDALGGVIGLRFYDLFLAAGLAATGAACAAIGELMGEFLRRRERE